MYDNTRSYRLRLLLIIINGKKMKLQNHVFFKVKKIREKLIYVINCAETAVTFRIFGLSIRLR